MAMTPIKQSSKATLPAIAPIAPTGHHIVQTLVGPVCTLCKKKVVKTKSNFLISDVTLRDHLNKNNCSNKEIKINIAELRRDLNDQMKAMHGIMQNNPAEANAMVDRCFPAGTHTFKSAFCRRCGYLGVQSKVKYHVDLPNNSNCKGYSEEVGDILKNDYGFEIPKAIIDDMRMGKFELPSGIASKTIIPSPPTPTLGPDTHQVIIDDMPSSPTPTLGPDTHQVIIDDIPSSPTPSLGPDTHQVIIDDMPNESFVSPFLDGLASNTTIPPSPPILPRRQFGHQSKSDDVPANVDKVYSIVKKQCRLGGNGSDGPIYGELVSDIYVCSFIWVY
jgi:hypothetical protein